MDSLQIFILSLIQGFTEFLPISSSAHLILLPKLTGWLDQGIAFDVALHLGSLLAVLAYFRHDIKQLLAAWWRHIRTGKNSAESRLVWAVGFGTIPVGLVGIMVADLMDGYSRSLLVIAIATLVFGIILGIADKYGKHQRDEYQMRAKDVLIIGIAQAFALIPGTSRSGATMSAALLLGFKRTAAARFSFLLSIPVIILAAGLESHYLFTHQIAVDWTALFWGFVLSAISAYICILYFLRLLNKIGMLPFVIYRLVLGVVLLGLIYT